MRIKVEFDVRASFLEATDTGDVWRGFPISFTVPGSPHALIDVPDHWAEDEINAALAPYADELFDDGHGPPEHPPWRYEHHDYLGLGFPVPTFPGALAEIGDTFSLHGLTAAVLDRGKRGAGVMIGVCDTGVDATHQDFQGVTVVGSGRNQDVHGHGTHVAATCAGIKGIASKASIFAGFALNNGGSGTEQSVAQSIRDVADAGCQVINLSLGGSPSSVMDSACDYAKGLGAVVCVAAGNAGGAPIGSPARAADLIVMAHDRNRQWASFTDGRGWSNANRVGFNGVQIRAAQANSGSRTTEMSGTSMACPHAAGVAALLVAAGMTRAQVVSYILGHRKTPPTDVGSSIAELDFGAAPIPEPPEEEPVADIRMIDFRSQILRPAGNGPMMAVPNIALHHTAVVTPQDGSAHALEAQFAQPLATWTQAQEEQHIRNIDAGHTSNPGIGLFAYHVMAFPSGRSYFCGDLNRQRAHIKDRNHEYVGICVAGDFTQQAATETIIAAVRHAIAMVRLLYPGAIVAGHGELAVPSSPTACPGVLTNIDWNSEEPELSPEEQRQLDDRKARVILDWLLTMEVNVRHNPGAFPNSLEFYKPGTGQILGSVMVESVPPWMAPGLG